MPLKEHWRRLHRRPRWVRWPVKAGFLLTVVALTLYPKVWLIPAWVQRLANLNTVLDPQHPGGPSFGMAAGFANGAPGSTTVGTVDGSPSVESIPHGTQIVSNSSGDITFD